MQSDFSLNKLLESISRYPAILILIFLLSGIFIVFSEQHYNIWLLIAAIVSISSYIVCRRLFKCDTHWLYIPLIISSLTVGCYRSSLNHHQPQLIPDNLSITVRVDRIIDHDNSMRVIASPLQIIDSVRGDYHAKYSSKLLLTIQGIDYSIYPGTLINFISNFKEIKNLGNPDEFDYSQYMNRQDVFLRQFIPNGGYNIVGYSPTFLNKISRLRMNLVKRLMQTSMRADSKHFLAAVFLGENQYIDFNVRKLYADIGVAHVLALSGLHIAIISMLIYFFLFPIDYVFDKRIRLILTAIALLLYAIITGLSVSVLRATLLAMLCGLAFCLRRKVNHFNLLAIAAIILLLINPLWLYDAGFQLSFMAVLFILLLADKLNFVPCHYKFIYSIFGALTVSVSAYLGTFMISAYYFNVIPILFIIPNIILLPILPLLLLIGLAAVVTQWSFIERLFDFAYDFINQIFSYIHSIPLSYFDNVNVGLFDVIFYFAIISLFIITLYYPKLWKLSIPPIMILSVIWLIQDRYGIKAPESLVVLNDYNETPIIIHSADSATLVLPADSIGTQFLNEFSQYNKKFFARRGIKKISQCVAVLPKVHDNIIISYADRDIVVIDGKLPSDSLPLDKRFHCNYLIITKKYYASIRRILSKFTPDTIILSGNIYDKRRNLLLHQISQYNMPYYDIKSSGALVVPKHDSY